MQVATMPMDKDQMRVIAEWMGTLGENDMEGMLSNCVRKQFAHTEWRKYSVKYEAITKFCTWHLFNPSLLAA